jgi:hypothetical protein
MEDSKVISFTRLIHQTFVFIVSVAYAVCSSSLSLVDLITLKILGDDYTSLIHSKLYTGLK